ncbi:MAG TPA: NDP-sugar synthase [Anaeromyxobacteraceae bacterium]|nr:NDP-sugar synthase [Anaeromyxobacteraceae bacterium]
MGDVAGLILCAGLGTRLRPLTERRPKPAVPVAGMPLVRWSLALLAGAGVRRAVVNVHHLPDAMAAAAAQAARAAGVALAVSREPVIAGTGGALREARPLLAGAEAVVVVNGDVLFDVDLGAVLGAHRRSGALATMVLAPMPAGASYAAVEADGALSVRRIAGRFGPGGEGLTPWHFTGVHVLAPALLDLVPAEPFELDVNRHVYPTHMAAGRIRGHVAGGYWNDLGTPARYLAANEDVLAGRVPLARFRAADPFAGSEPFAEPRLWLAPGAHVEPGACLHAPAVLGRGARVEAGASIGPYAVVGEGARIAAGARVAHAVVWDGTALAPGEEVVRAVAAGADRVPA